MKKLTAFLTIILLISNYGFSKGKTLSPPVDPKTTIPATILVTNKIDSITAETYKMLYENQIKSNSEILKTIFYALGGLGTAMIFVFASNWWFNEKKVDEIRKGINSQITTEVNKMQTDLQKEITASITSLTLLFNEFTDKIRAEIKEDNKELVNNYQKQLETFNANYSQQITTLNEALNAQNSNINEIINSKDLLLKELILSEHNDRTTSINQVSSKLHRVEFYMWKDSGVPNNAFIALIEELSIKLKANSSVGSIRLTLQQMSEILNSCSSLYHSYKKSALEILENIPKDEESLKFKNEILEKIEKIEIKK